MLKIYVPCAITNTKTMTMTDSLLGYSCCNPEAMNQIGMAQMLKKKFLNIKSKLVSHGVVLNVPCDVLTTCTSL